MAHIVDIVISNFRSYKNKQNNIKNMNNINVFTGKNNSGKTNILRAINIFFNPSEYDPKIDRNMIKVITGGSSQHPNIKVVFEDDNIIGLKNNRFTIELNLNAKKGNQYRVLGKVEVPRLNTSNKIETYLKQNFKCVYLSTTDESISDQAYSLINDMILQYYKRKNNSIKESIEIFESNYKRLLDTFEDNITGLEEDLNKQFDIFKKSEIDMKPRLIFGKEKKLTDFLLENIKLELDDSYSQHLQVKGAGIQRTSLVLISLFLLNEIYNRSNKIILLDEPEAFLYPLLVKEVKQVIENTSINKNECQIMMTSHSREFLSEINNEHYNFYYIDQEKEIENYARSSNDEDIVKYSVINTFDNSTKYKVLKNYGLLDEIDDHENVIVCEGETDKNYIIKILEDKPFRPQIRYSRYQNNPEGEEIEEFHKNYFPRGASSIIPILLYLDNVSSINRKVFVLLDGDKEGLETAKKIERLNFINLEIKVYTIPIGKEIEDMVFEKEKFIEKVINFSSDIKKHKKNYISAMESVKESESLVVRTELFMQAYGIDKNIIHQIKNRLSQDNDGSNLCKSWLISELNEIFYK